MNKKLTKNELVEHMELHRENLVKWLRKNKFKNLAKVLTKVMAKNHD